MEKEARRQALVLAGGGLAGAFQAGVIQALSDGASPANGHAPLDPGILAGTSVGAYNAAVLACRPRGSAAESAAYLQEIWLRRIGSGPGRCGNGIYRLRANPLTLLDPRCFAARPLEPVLNLAADAAFLTGRGILEGVGLLRSPEPFSERALRGIDLSALFDLSPFRALIRDTVDLEALQRSDKGLVIATSDWRRGTYRFFSKQEIVHLGGVRPIVASGTLPGVFPPVEIEGSYYVDGGILVNAPLAPPLFSGARTIHLVYAYPRLGETPLARLASSIEAAFRLTVMNWIGRLEAYLGYMRRWNELIGRAADVHAMRAAASVVTDLPIDYLETVDASELGPVTVHCHSPSPFGIDGLDLLTFDEPMVRECLETGYRNAVEHDCRAAECILPASAAGGG